MKELLDALVNKILLVWSFSPILVILDSSNGFCNLRYAATLTNDGRHSLGIAFVHLRFGMSIVQLFSFTAQDFKLVRLIRLEDVRKYNKDEASFEQREQAYRAHLNLISADDERLEAIAIDKQVENYQKSIDTITKKMQSLQTLIVAMVPALAVIYQARYTNDNWAVAAMVVANVYLILNLLLVDISFLAAHNRIYSSFSDLRKSKSKKIESMVQRYMDWQYMIPVRDSYATYLNAVRDIILVSLIVNVIYWLIIGTNYIFPVLVG